MLPVMRALASQHTEAASLPIHAAVAALAAGRHRVVSRAQLRGIGMSDTAITGAVARGQLHTVRRGVFAVGHPLLGAHGRWMAAVPALGPGTRLSHGSAADLWGIRRSATARIDATVPGPADGGGASASIAGFRSRRRRERSSTSPQSWTSGGSRGRSTAQIGCRALALPT